MPVPLSAAAPTLLLLRQDRESLPIWLLLGLRQLLRNLHEQRLYIIRVFGGRFHVQDPVLLGVVIRLVEINLPTRLQVRLVPGLAGKSSPNRIPSASSEVQQDPHDICSPLR